jgi:hypothetical protein
MNSFVPVVKSTESFPEVLIFVNAASDSQLLVGHNAVVRPARLCLSDHFSKTGRCCCDVCRYSAHNASSPYGKVRVTFGGDEAIPDFAGRVKARPADCVRYSGLAQVDTLIWAHMVIDILPTRTWRTRIARVGASSTVWRR